MISLPGGGAADGGAGVTRSRGRCCRWHSIGAKHRGARTPACEHSIGPGGWVSQQRVSRLRDATPHPSMPTNNKALDRIRRDRMTQGRDCRSQVRQMGSPPTPTTRHCAILVESERAGTCGPVASPIGLYSASLDAASGPAPVPVRPGVLGFNGHLEACPMPVRALPWREALRGAWCGMREVRCERMRNAGWVMREVIREMRDASWIGHEW